MGLNDITIVIQPLGSTPEVLGPPLAKYRPDIIVLITSDQSYVDLFYKHLNSGWQRYVKNPYVIVRLVHTPWTSDSVDRFMVEFDEAVKEIEEMPETKGKNLYWHVGTAGGTNPIKNSFQTAIMFVALNSGGKTGPKLGSIQHLMVT